MGLIPQIKCSRCDRKYSGLLAKCPYCGARRRKKGTRAVTNDNATWKMVVGLLLLVVLIAAVVVLLVTSISENKNTEPDDSQQNSSGIGNLDDNVNSIGEPSTVDPDTIPDNQKGLPIDDEPEEPDEPVTPTVTSVIITYGGRQVGVYNDTIDKYEFTMNAGDEIQLGVKVTPDDTGLEPVWATDDESVLTVLQSGKVTAISPTSATATITVTVGGITQEVFVRVRS